MSEVQETPGVGWSDEELLAYPLVYRPDLFAGKLALVSGGGSGLWQCLLCVGFVKQPLPLQIAGLDVVPVDDDHAANARTGQGRRVKAAECAATNDDGT